MRGESTNFLKFSGGGPPEPPSGLRLRRGAVSGFAGHTLCPPTFKNVPTALRRSQFCPDSSTIRLVFSRVGSRRYLCTRRRSNRVNEPAPITGPWHVPAICYISIDKSTPFRFRVREIYVTVSYIITVRTDVDCSVARSENIFVFFRVGNSRRFGNEKF